MNAIALPRFLTGERLYLRPLDRETDLERSWRWIHDPAIRRYLAIRLPITREAEMEWLSRRSPNDLSLAIVLNDSDRHIGNIGLHTIDWVQRCATTGTVIGERTCWGQGYGREAKLLLLDYAFRTLNLHRIETSVLAPNERSLRCQKKCGYKEEGTRRQRFFVDGAWVDDILLAALRDEWVKEFPRHVSE